MTVTQPRALAATRRSLLVGAAVAAWAGPALAASPAPAPRRDLSFAIWRGGQKIGAHKVSFQGSDTDFTVAIAAEMLVKLGPIPVFHYRHEAQEVWAGGRFHSLSSRTTSNGAVEQLTAIAGPGGVAITGGKARHTAPPGACPLTHWNAAALSGPLFNPQTGEIIHVSVTRAAGGARGASRYVLAGDANLTDWYDDAGAWSALLGQAPDKSIIDYRRMS